MAGDEGTDRLPGEQAREQREEIREIGLDLEDLAFRPAAKARRVEDEQVVAVPAAQFAFEEFRHVVHDPADGLVLERIQRGVLARPLDHALRGIHVADLRARARGGERASAGVREEIQHARRASVPRAECGAILRDALPLLALLGENPEVPEVRRAELECDAVHLDDPRGRQLLAALPFVAAFARESRRRRAPRGGPRLLPDRLGAGPREHDVAEAFEFLKRAAVEQLVIGMGLCDVPFMPDPPPRASAALPGCTLPPRQFPRRAARGGLTRARGGATGAAS